MLCLVAERFALVWPEMVTVPLLRKPASASGSTISIDALLESFKICVVGEVRFYFTLVTIANSWLSQNVALRIEQHLPFKVLGTGFKYSYQQALHLVHEGHMGLQGLENPWTKGFLPHNYSVGVTVSAHAKPQAISKPR
jgi:hypothetical protein